MTDNPTDPDAICGRSWQRLAEAERHLAHIDAQAMLLKLRRTHAQRRRDGAADMVMAAEAVDLDGELQALTQGVTDEEGECDE